MIQEENHIFQGMRRDNHLIKQDSKFLWDAHNIRLTNRDDSTFLSITNEKGTSDPLVTLESNYVGHCVLGKYLIVFTANYNGSNSYIYRIEKEGNSYNTDILFHLASASKDSWSPQNPILALGFYETELVLKVYWVDGKNLPRVINIVADKLTGVSLDTEDKRKLVYPEGCFDFVRELELKENITITKEDGDGSFAPGTILYAFSYYNKYGLESNIFYVSLIMYISHNDRGGKPGDVLNNAFKISIKNLDLKFLFLRIYSIHRTSLDSVPTVKRVADIELPLGLSDPLSTEILYTDNGRVGDIEDPTRLLYIGGEDISAGTITQKDNTLFLGNIELKRRGIPSKVEKALTPAENQSIIDYVSVAPRSIKLSENSDSSSLYLYNSLLSSGNVSTFKIGDTYRLGILFQHKSGKWSLPVYIGDIDIPDKDDSIKPKLYEEDSLKYLRLPSIIYRLPNNVLESLIPEGFIKARPLVVLPSIHERMVLALGVLCPTVFQVKDRLSNTPFALASWFFRPMIDSSALSLKILDGSAVEVEHLKPLYSAAKRGAEIQNMENKSIEDISQAVSKDKSINSNTFFVDQSIITLNSPDIEFNPSTRLAIDGKELNLNIVGLVQFTTNAGDISITTSSPTPAPSDNGFYHKSMLSFNDNGNPLGLISGMFYKSHPITKLENKYNAYEYDNDKYELNWLIYPWHRSGSLNNDINRPSDSGTRSSVLKRKVISNIRISKDNFWFSSPWPQGNLSKFGQITPVSIFDSNEVSLIKIPTPLNSNIGSINYYGNVDSLITCSLTSGYNFWIAPNEGVKGTYFSDAEQEAPNPFIRETLISLGNKKDGSNNPISETLLKVTKDPVRIKYKSTPHAVFAFNYLQESKLPTILPNVNGELNKLRDIDASKLFWFNTNISIDPPSSGDINVLGEIKLRANGWHSGSQTEIENNIILELANYTKNEYGTEMIAIALCSILPNDQDAADVYYRSSNDDDATAGWLKYTNFLEYNIGQYYVYNGGDGQDLLYYKIVKMEDKPRYYLHLEKLASEENPEGEIRKVLQGSINGSNFPKNGTLFLAELRRPSKPNNMFGGKSKEALRNNMWIPAGEPITLSVEDANKNILLWIWGDTYYLRYDCLKTYSFTNEDENSVIEIASFMCETRINIEGRYDRNRGLISNLNMSPINFNLLNDVYTLNDNFFTYRIFDEDYFKLHTFRNQITWSLLKQAGSDVDLWTNITLANVLDLNGENGKITSLNTWNEYLLCFLEKALNLILFNSRVQIPTTDGVPIELSNSAKVEGCRLFSDVIGCANKWSIVSSPQGLYFVDSNTNDLYLFNGQLNNISLDRGMSWWISLSLPYKVWSPYGYPDLNGLRAFCDNTYGDIYLSPGPFKGYNKEAPDALCYSELLGLFISFMSYGGTQAMFNYDDGFFSIRSDESGTNLYKNNVGNYNNFYGKIKGWDFSLISNSYPTQTKIFDTVNVRADMYVQGKSTPLGDMYTTTKLEGCPFNFMRVINEYQDTGNEPITAKNFRKKFRVWRGLLPRSLKSSSDNRKRARIRNPWAMITLGWVKPDDIQDVLGPLSSIATDFIYSTPSSTSLVYLSSDGKYYADGLKLSDEVQSELKEIEQNKRVIIHDISVNYSI